MDRRNFIIKTFLASLACMGRLQAQTDSNLPVGTMGNFQTIYNNPQLKDRFLLFLSNVFNLFPEKELHQLLAEMTNKHKDDKAIYLAVQNQLEDISPMLSLLRYQIPALMHQKDEMSTETV
ncbi:MAG: hypothetical protein GQ531_08595, partial [Sulfurovum sp.]|nr:hypothetical protein [Sulfurovum sp.]